MQNDQTITHKTARIISVIGHPFILLPTTVLIATVYSMPAMQALKIVAITILITVVPLLFIIRRKVAAGKWSDHDVSNSSERRSFYPIVIGIVLFCYIVFRLLNFPGSLLNGLVISFVLLILAMIINHWSKISLHLTFASYCAVSLIAVNLWIGAGFILLTILVGWSRIVLKRHTFVQVLCGFALGAMGGICLLKLVKFF